MDLLLFFADLYALFNIHLRPTLHPSLSAHPWMSCKIKGLATPHTNETHRAGVIPISWWWAAYSKHIYQRCWGLQTTSLYDQTKHIWLNTEWTRGLFPQKNQHHLLNLHATGQQGHHTLLRGGGVIPATQHSEIQTVMCLEITGLLLNLGTEVSARTKRLQSHRLMPLRPLFWYTNPLFKISAHTPRLKQGNLSSSRPAQLSPPLITSPQLLNYRCVACICCAPPGCSWTAEVSPPWSAWPQVTTEPSAKIAATANGVACICCTPLSWSWTAELSPP